MKRFWESPAPAVILLLGSEILGYLAMHQHSEIVRVDLEFKTSDQAGRKRMGELRQQLAAVQAAQAALEKQAAQAQLAAPAKGEQVTVHESDIVRDHPEYAAILARQQRRQIMQQYGDAFAGLNLRPDQLAKLKDLLVERNLAVDDARQAAKAAGLDQNTPGFSTAITQAMNSVNQELTAVLGTDGSAAVRKLQNVANAQRQVEYGAPTYEDAGVPLTPDQTTALAQGMLAAQQGGHRTDYYQADPATGLSPANNQQLEAAAKVLSPAQLQIMKTSQIQSNQESAILNPYFKQMSGSNMGIRIEP